MAKASLLLYKSLWLLIMIIINIIIWLLNVCDTSPLFYFHEINTEKYTTHLSNKLTNKNILEMLEFFKKIMNINTFISV